MKNYKKFLKMCILSTILGLTAGCNQQQGTAREEPQFKKLVGTEELFEKFGKSEHIYKGYREEVTTSSGRWYRQSILEFDSDGDGSTDAVLLVKLSDYNFSDDDEKSMPLRVRIWNLPPGTKLKGDEINRIAFERERVLYVKKEQDNVLRERFAYKNFKEGEER